MLKIVKKLFRSEYYYFGIIGGTGFVIDSGIFTLLHRELDYPLSRVISILIAMTFTWFCNRTFTFKATEKISHREWLRYTKVSVTGALMNFSIFISLCHLSVLLKQYYIIPLMMATSVTMFFNFTLSKYYVFKPRSR